MSLNSVAISLLSQLIPEVKVQNSMKDREACLKGAHFCSILDSISQQASHGGNWLHFSANKAEEPRGGYAYCGATKSTVTAS